jgi:hypothetical protein
MAGTKKRTSKRRLSRRRLSKRRGFLGGATQGLASVSASVDYPNNGGGGAGWVEGKYGNSVFDIGSKTLGNSFTHLPPSLTPTPQSLALIQSAGRRRGRKSRKGGFLMGEVVNQAVVPFGLLALQNRYGRRKSRMNKSRRSRSRSRK